MEEAPVRPRGHSIVSGSSAPPPLPLPTSRRSKVFRKSVSEVNVLRVSQREGSKVRTLPGAPRAPPGTESGAPPLTPGEPWQVGTPLPHASHGTLTFGSDSSPARWARPGHPPHGGGSPGSAGKPPAQGHTAGTPGGPGPTLNPVFRKQTEDARERASGGGGEDSGLQDRIPEAAVRPPSLP